MEHYVLESRNRKIESESKIRRISNKEMHQHFLNLSGFSRFMRIPSLAILTIYLCFGGEKNNSSRELKNQNIRLLLY